MFSFMDFGMPSMYGNSGRSSMRASARPSHRGLDTWGFFDPHPEPMFQYQPRHTATTRQRPSYYNYNNSYNDQDEYAGYEHLGRAPRASYANNRRPQYYRAAAEEDEEVEPQSVPTFRPTARSQRTQPKNSQSLRHSNQYVGEEVQHPATKPQTHPQASDQPHPSFRDQFRSEPFSQGSHTARHSAYGSQFAENAHSKATNKPLNKHTTQREDARSDDLHKATQNTTQPQQKQQKTSKKPTETAQANQSINHEHVTGKIVIKQDKGDMVVIEDMTPIQPKRDPTMEPAKGLLIEEVDPSQN